jgi:signal transduction histidine kinase
LEALAARMAELHGADGGPGAPAETVSAAGGAALGTGAGTPELRAALPELTGHIDTAISRFRSIVRGVYPSVLTDHGLGAALENLAEAVERPTLLRCSGLPRFGARVEAGIYFCLAALLRGWPSTSEERVRITLTVEDGELRGTVWDPAAHEISAVVDPVMLETALDRIAALDGRFEAVGSASGLVLEIRVPEAAR